MKGPCASRQTRRRNADCSVGLVNVDHVVETFFISEILSLSRRLTKASTKASRPVVWTPLLNAVEMSAMWRRLNIVLGSSANCFWTLDPSRLKPPSRKSVVVSVKQGTHVSQCSAAGPHRSDEAIRACMRLLLAGVDPAFAHGSPRVRSALADFCQV